MARAKRYNHALIDADIFLYKVAIACTKDVDWGDGEVMSHIDIKEAGPQLKASINEIAKRLGTKEITVALTCLEGNWRRSVLSTYKHNRTNVKKPVGFLQLREYLKENFATFERPTLEADDILGILQTRDNSKTVIVSTDKDMKTIPGWHHNPDKRETFNISVDEADWWHMLQTLMGDSTDGYSGCPGIGEVKANRLLTDIPPELTMWDKVKEAFANKDLAEEDALVQARVARICRVEDYNFKKKEVILWEP